jgi:peptidyl-tRNA hydrolase
VPIKATVVNVASPVFGADGYDASNDWTSQTLTVEQVNALSGVDLHSEIASNNSVVFVSTKKHDVKVPAGTELKLAIGPASDPSTPTN